MNKLYNSPKFIKIMATHPHLPPLWSRYLIPYTIQANTETIMDSESLSKPSKHISRTTTQIDSAEKSEPKVRFKSMSDSNSTVTGGN